MTTPLLFGPPNAYARSDRLVRCLVGALFLTPALVFGQAPSLTRLSWLSGCWALDGSEAGTSEQWMTPMAGSLIGMARTVKGGRTVQHEFMQIREDAAASLAFIALPSGKTQTTFLLVRQSDAEVVFENPTHDFPQRVIYRQLSPNRALGRIEGVRNGRLRGIDFPMTREACPPAVNRGSTSSPARVGETSPVARLP